MRELKNVAERAVVRSRSGTLTPADLPREFATARVQPSAAAQGLRGKLSADRLLDRMLVHGESLWTVVYEPFMSRDLTRDDLRTIIAAGVAQTRGNYKVLAQSFNLEPSGYKRFLNFLRTCQCNMPSGPLRVARVRPAAADPARDAFATSARA